VTPATSHKAREDAALAPQDHVDQERGVDRLDRIQGMGQLLDAARG
jgi:hypothetical protein